MVKTMGMMKAIVKFHEKCLHVLEATARSEKKISMGFIEQQLGGEQDIIVALSKMKFQIPTIKEEEMRKYFDDLHLQIEKRFNDLLYGQKA